MFDRVNRPQQGLRVGLPQYGRQSDFLQLVPGRIVGLVGPPGLGLTRLGLSYLVEASRIGPVAAVDVRGWLAPAAAWEMGVEPERLVVVRCADRRLWPQVLAALPEGVGVVFAEVPGGIGDQHLRRLAALTRARKGSLVLRPLTGDLPTGLTHLRLQGAGVDWEGVEQGRGRLQSRRLQLEASGSVMAGMTRQVEVEDVGADLVRLVPGVVAGRTRVAVG